MGATPPPAPKSRRRSPAQPRRAATAAAPRPQIALDERIGVTHLTAEYWPFARTGGLGEAVKIGRAHSSHEWISYAVFCLKKKKSKTNQAGRRAVRGDI